MKSESASSAWALRLAKISIHGQRVSPRGQPTLELLHPEPIIVDMNRPALVCEDRQPGFRFMAAEARWILTGDDRVKTIASFANMIKQFSDDGIRFYGAYGPRVSRQLPYVVRTLAEDRDTRQAWLSIWRENPPPTKDVPCTLMLGWSIRDGKLHCHAYMRSSDIWLGIPYDVFNFSLLSAWVRHQLNTIYDQCLDLGDLHLTAASSHLYERDLNKAQAVLDSGRWRPCRKMPTNFANVMLGLNHQIEGQDEQYLHPDAWRFWEADPDPVL